MWNWADAGIAWGWPGVAGLIVSILAVNILMLVLRMTKPLWTDVWSYWHGSALAGFVWALTGGNVFLGILAGVLYLVVGSLMSDLTAKKYQEFNDMPGIGVPCGTTVQASLFAMPVVLGCRIAFPTRGLGCISEGIDASVGWVNLAFWNSSWVSSSASSPMVRRRPGHCQDPWFGHECGSHDDDPPRMVSIIAEGIVPITMSIVQYMRERFKDREIYVAVDCAVLLGHPAVGFDDHSVPALCCACSYSTRCANAAHRLPGCGSFLGWRSGALHQR